MVRGHRTYSYRTNASTGPNRRMRTARRVPPLMVIAGDRRRSCDGLVIGWKHALFAPFALFTMRPLRWSRACDAARNRGEKPAELVERARSHQVYFRLHDRPRSSASVRGLVWQCLERARVALGRSLGIQMQRGHSLRQQLPGIESKFRHSTRFIRRPAEIHRDMRDFMTIAFVESVPVLPNQAASAHAVARCGNDGI